MVNNLRSRVLALRIIAMATAIAIIPVGYVLADTSNTDYIFLIDSNQQSCQQIGEAYQQVKAFETTNFYVNICQKENNFYYLGEAKTGSIEEVRGSRVLRRGLSDTIFLPANSLASGEMYRASNGNMAYIVTILPHEAILTIERNGAQVAIESSLKNHCINPLDNLQIAITSPMYYPMSDASIQDHGYLQLNKIETISVDRFYNFDSLAEYDSKASSNLSTCN